jgi:hypothetical protein
VSNRLFVGGGSDTYTNCSVRWKLNLGARARSVERGDRTSNVELVAYLTLDGVYFLKKVVSSVDEDACTGRWSSGAIQYCQCGGAIFGLCHAFSLLGGR